MSKQEKALRRLLSKPKDFTWSELVTVLTGLGYMLEKGSGSRRRFFHPQTLVPHHIHEPHPSGILKPYQVNDLIKFLREENHL
jgi:predicted RNA binding protein YcfA (HicA-like mRNA interferase family)